MILEIYLKRLGLPIIAVVLAYFAMQFGEVVFAGTASINWRLLNHFPFLLPIPSAWPDWIWLVGAALLMLLTVIEAYEKCFEYLFAKRTRFLSTGDIVWLSILLWLCAVGYGALVGPFATSTAEGVPLSTWLCMSALSIPFWAALTPMLYATLNSVREVHHAFAEYERHARGMVSPERQWLAELSKLNETVAKIEPAIAEQVEILRSAINVTDGRRDTEALRAIHSTLGSVRDHVKVLAAAQEGVDRRMDGMFARVRELHQTAIRGKAPAGPRLVGA